VIESFECNLILSLDLESVSLQKFQSFFCRTQSFLVALYLLYSEDSFKRQKKIGKRKKIAKVHTAQLQRVETICIPAVTMASSRARTNISKSDLKCAQQQAQAHGSRRRSARKIMYVQARAGGGRRAERRNENERKKEKEKRRSANVE